MPNHVSLFPDLYEYEETAQSLFTDLCAHEPLKAILDGFGIEGGVLCVATHGGSVLAQIRFGEEGPFTDIDQATQDAINAAEYMDFSGYDSRTSAFTHIRCEPGAIRCMKNILACRLNGYTDGMSAKDQGVVTDLSELFVIAFSLRLRRMHNITEIPRDFAAGILSRYTSDYAPLFDPFLERARLVLL